MFFDLVDMVPQGYGCMLVRVVYAPVIQQVKNKGDCALATASFFFFFFLRGLF